MLFPRRSRVRYSGAFILIYCALAATVLIGVGNGIHSVNSINLMRMHELAIHSSLLRSEAEMLLDAAARPGSRNEWQTYATRLGIRLGSIKGAIREIEGNLQGQWAVIPGKLSQLQAEIRSIDIAISIGNEERLRKFRSMTNNIMIELRELSENTIDSQTSTLRGFASSVFILSMMIAALGLLGVLLLLHRRDQILQLLRLSNEDGLTGLATRRYAQRKGIQRSDQARAQNSVLTLAILDIDHFKLVNDTFGHAVGDEVICYVASALKRLGVNSGTAARFGGEEFLVILPRVDVDEAMLLFTRLQADLAERWPIPNVPPTTVSVGIASAKGEGVDFAKLYQQADTALYSAKRNGRNRISTHDCSGHYLIPTPAVQASCTPSRLS